MTYPLSSTDDLGKSGKLGVARLARLGFAAQSLNIERARKEIRIEWQHSDFESFLRPVDAVEVVHANFERWNARGFGQRQAGSFEEIAKLIHRKAVDRAES